MRRMIGFLAAAVGAAAIAGPPAPAEAAQRPNPREVKDIRPGSVRSKPRRMVEYRGDVYFDANDGAHGTELWRTDGTARGTELAADIVPGAESSSPIGPIVRAGDRLFFSAGPSSGRSVFASNGTQAGTAPVPGTEGTNPFAFVPAQGRFYFRVPIEDGPYSGASSALWTGDGTQAGTHEIRAHRFSESQDCPGLGASAANSVTVVRPLAFFCSYDAEHGAEPWRTDGTVAGTGMVADIVPGPGSSQSGSFTRLGDEVVFFVRRDGRAELWRSDGTEAGTGLVSAIPADQRVGRPLVSGGRVFFFATTSDSTLIWSSDGTPSGTTAVDGLPFFAGADEAAPAPGGTVLFSAYRRRTGSELWRTDGTGPGTRLVKDIAPGHGRDGSGRSSEPQQLTTGRGEVLFTAAVARRGRELWRSDGTRVGTTLVGEVRRGRPGGDIHEITPIGDRVFFAATTPRHGQELWIARRR